MNCQLAVSAIANGGYKKVKKIGFLSLSSVMCECVLLGTVERFPRVGVSPVCIHTILLISSLFIMSMVKHK